MPVDVPQSCSTEGTAYSKVSESETFVSSIQVLQWYKRKPATPSLFIFENSTVAAAHNASILAQFNYNIDQAIRARPNSQTMYGYEFKPSEILAPLLSNHPLWSKLKEVLDSGATFPLNPISTTDRELDLSFHLERGNHKSAIKSKTILDNLISEDISRGFALPLPLDILPMIPNASIAPLGCQEQETINERGERIPKFRMTHDQTFPGPSGLSVNLRVNKELLPPCMYSHVLKRIIHYIVHIRQRHPLTKIFLCKFDLDAAYCRCHLSSQTATECLTTYNGLLLMALRMTFGGAPCPSLWGYISETMIDLSNALIQNKYWGHNAIYDKISTTLPAPIHLPDTIPFGQAKEMSVSLPTNDIGFSDVYIDDAIGIAPDIEDNVSRVNRAIPLSITTIANPPDLSESIPRNFIISMKKFIAEGKMEESKTILGWVINTRSLIISLPVDKYDKWSKDIQLLISSKQVCSSQLETIIGHLNHTASILSMMRHFMGRICQALYRSLRNGWTCLRLCEKSDLHLMVEFLAKAKNRISLNNITFRKPTHLYRSDASEFGLAGYNMLSGKAWRFQLPINCRLKTSLNSLEFIACIITIWIDIYNNEIADEACILSQTDSSSAAGWLRKSNFCDKEDSIVQMTVARHLAQLIIGANSCLYSQWFPGESNVVADCLSRDFHLDDKSITHLITTCALEQVPFGFHLYPLPTEIVSWLTCLLSNQPCKEQWSKAQTRSSLSRGVDIKPTYNQLESHPIGTLITSLNPNTTGSLEHLLTPSEMVDSLLKEMLPLNLTQSEPPWTAWLRPTSWLLDQTLDLMPTQKLHSFYNVN
jgi:hypothetical protein